MDVCTGTEVVGGSGAVALKVGVPTAALVLSKQTRLTRASDPAALAPIGVGTSSQLSVFVDYADGRRVDFTNDPRTVFSVTSGSELVEVKGGVASVVAGSAGFGYATIRATFPTYSAAANISAGALVHVVGLASLRMSANPYPAYPGSGAARVSALQRFACTAAYQQAQANLTAVLTDSTVFDVSNASTFQSSAPGVVAVSGARLAGLTAGQASISGAFSGVQSDAPLALTVRNSGVKAASLSMSTSWASATTFVGLYNSTQQLSVDVTLEDGTRLLDAVRSVDWLPISSLVTFSSDTPSAISVSGGGVASLVGNSYRGVAIQALPVTGGCPIGEASTAKPALQTVYANLDPGLGDVDLGSRFGLPIPPLASGGAASLDVRINSSAAGLMAFQVAVTLDPAYLTVVNCTAGPDWLDLLFSCTINTPPSEVLIIGSSVLGAGHAGGLLTVATLRLVARTGVAVTALGGRVEAMVRGDGGDLGDAARSMLAGGIAVAINRGTTLIPTIVRNTTVDLGPAVYSNLPPARQLPQTADCSGTIHGDVSGDCAFDVVDVLLAQRIQTLQPGFC